MFLPIPNTLLLNTMLPKSTQAVHHVRKAGVSNANSLSNVDWLRNGDASQEKWGMATN